MLVPNTAMPADPRAPRPAQTQRLVEPTAVPRVVRIMAAVAPTVFVPRSGPTMGPQSRSVQGTLSGPSVAGGAPFVAAGPGRQSLVRPPSRWIRGALRLWFCEWGEIDSAPNGAELFGNLMRQSPLQAAHSADVTDGVLEECSGGPPGFSLPGSSLSVRRIPHR